MGLDRYEDYFRKSRRSGNTLIEVNAADINSIVRELNDILRSVSDLQVRKKIMRPAADVVVDTAKRFAPVSRPRKRKNIDRKFPPKRLKTDIKYTYNTPKLVRSRRAGQGYGRVSGKYIIGNLRASITNISEARGSKYKSEIIGPFISRRQKVTKIQDPAKMNAYYAAMIYGNALSFRRIVMERAIVVSREKVVSIVEKGVNEAITKQTAKNNYVK